MEIRITHDGNERDIEEIHRLLKAYNASRREKAENIPIGIFCEDESGKKLAGLTGEVFGNWLCIKYLYVDESLRGRGIGTDLIVRAEAEARDRGCKYVFTDTFSFQAPGFYRKLNYKEVFVLNGYPYSEKRYYYTKEL